MMAAHTHTLCRKRWLRWAACTSWRGNLLAQNMATLCRNSRAPGASPVLPRHALCVSTGCGVPST